MSTNTFEQHFLESAALKTQMAEALSASLQQAGEMLVRTLKQGHQIFSCGNGGSAADAQHFAAELVGRFEKERSALPAIALTTDTSNLTAIANDYGFEQIFARQLQALGQAHDCLLAISTSGHSPNVIRAIEVAHQKQMHVIALTGKDGGKIAHLLTENDVLIHVPHARTARIQEVHITAIHALCSFVDEHF